MPPNVLVLGGVSYNLMIFLDRLPAPQPQTLWSQRYHETIGETGAGKALHLSKLGMDTTFFALIGDDEYGDRIRERLGRERMTFVHDIDPRGTQRHVNVMDPHGQRVSIIFEGGSPNPPFDPARMTGAIAAADTIVLNLDNYCRRFMPLLAGASASVWCDIHDYDGTSEYHRAYIDAAEYIFMSSDRMPNYHPFMEQLIAGGKKLVVCTHGRDGSTALTPDGRWYVMPIVDSYERVDTNGAGDGYFAGFLYGHARDYDIERCMQLATVVSGLAVTSTELAYPDLTADLAEGHWSEHFESAPHDQIIGDM